MQLTLAKRWSVGLRAVGLIRVLGWALGSRARGAEFVRASQVTTLHGQLLMAQDSDIIGEMLQLKTKPSTPNPKLRPYDHRSSDSSETHSKNRQAAQPLNHNPSSKHLLPVNLTELALNIEIPTRGTACDNHRRRTK